MQRLLRHYCASIRMGTVSDTYVLVSDGTPDAGISIPGAVQRLLRHLPYT